MDKHGFNGMKITGPKVFATFVITTLGFAFFMISPLWVGLLLVIPGFSMYLRYVLKQDLKFNNNMELSYLKKASINSKSGYQHSSTLYGVNCTSLIDRKNKYGY